MTTAEPIGVLVEASPSAGGGGGGANKLSLPLSISFLLHTSRRPSLRPCLRSREAICLLHHGPFAAGKEANPFSLGGGESGDGGRDVSYFLFRFSFLF